MNENISRKEFMQRFALMGLAVAGGGSLLLGCGGGEKSDTSGDGHESTAQTTNAADPCSDYSALSETDLQMRNNLKYEATSTEPGKNCENCKFYQAPQEGAECGGCQLFKGPIHTAGYCTSWFAKDQG